MVGRHALAFALIFAAVACSDGRRPVLTTFYPTYGYLNDAGDEWTIPVRVWVHGPHVRTQGLLESLSAEGRERELFGERIADIVGDSLSRQVVRFVFDEDPQQQTFRVATDRGESPPSDLNGVVEGRIRLSRARAERAAHAVLRFGGAWRAAPSATRDAQEPSASTTPPRLRGGCAAVESRRRDGYPSKMALMVA